MVELVLLVCIDFEEKRAELKQSAAVLSKRQRAVKHNEIETKTKVR